MSTSVKKTLKEIAVPIAASEDTSTCYDWKEAFPRQCPKLGVEAFIKSGVRPSLIPLIVNYLQDRKMKVKWHGETSKERNLNGGGPQGATFGIWKYLAQSNNSADCVEPEYRFKFVDDLTVLEKINLLITGLASFNAKSRVPSDISFHKILDRKPENDSE